MLTRINPLAAITSYLLDQLRWWTYAEFKAWRRREALSRLDERQLKDIGLMRVAEDDYISHPNAPPAAARFNL